MSGRSYPTVTKKEIPENCTLCGGSFVIDDPTSKAHGKRVIWPYPMKEWLCRKCFLKSLDAGLGRLNKVLAGQPLTQEDWDSPTTPTREG